MGQRAWGYENRTTLVCIDNYDEGIPKGRFYNAFCNTEKSFCGLLSFLRSMEESLDQMDFPRAYTARRSFAETAASSADPPDECRRTGKHATFAIQILFRQNTSWQGSITWLDEKREESFRSVLELSLLIGSALDSKSKI